LHEKGLIANIKIGVKLLGPGKLKLEKLKFSNIKISESARQQIEKMHGQVAGIAVPAKQTVKEEKSVVEKNNKK